MEVMVSPVPGFTWRQSPVTDSHCKTHSCSEHEQTIKPEREKVLHIPHQPGHHEPKQPENELRKLKRDHGNET